MNTRARAVSVRLCLLPLIALLAQAAYAAPPVDWAAVHDATMRGIDRFYRLETDAAIHTFDSVAHMAPGDPRGPFFLSIVHFSLYVLDHDRRQFDAFMAASDRTIDACESLLDQNDHDANAKFYLGGIRGYRGMLFQTDGSMLKAISEGRQAYVLLDEAVTDKPDLYDAHMGFGLFRYLVTKAPRSFHWVLKLVGITPDLEGGLQSLRLAAEKGVYTRNEARLYLAQFLFNEHRSAEAFTYLNQLCSEYPENTLFLILRASLAQRDGRPDDALADALEALRRDTAHPLRYVEEIAYSSLGGIYWARNDFASSRKYYTLYVDSLRIPERVTNWMWYRYGAACELTGDRAAAIAAYTRAKKGKDDLRPNEAYYYRRAQEQISRPLTDVETGLIKAGNLSSAKQYPAALQLYTTALDLAAADQELASRALLGILQVQYELKQDDDLVRTAPRLFALSPRRELWVVPQGYLKYGQALARLGRKDEARKAFKQVREYDGYDFQDQTEQRVEEEVKKLDE
jgi:tetratricopeptide (TPR) repeat protein